MFSYFCALAAIVQMVMVEDGIRVKWDGSAWIKIQIQEANREKVCGLCGNFNGDETDDWTIGPGDLCMDEYPDAVTGELVGIILL